MPPRRRAANTGQSTLSFGSQARVTKPVTAPQAKTKTLDSPRTKSPATPEPQLTDVPELSKPHVAELVVRQQAKAEVEAPHTEEDKRALQLNKQDIWRYWRAQDENRLAPPAHQEDLDMEEKILRHFDLSSQYGPCIGIARVKRWRRANKLNLNPPIEVLAVLLKGKDTKQRAYVDELLS
ncbi:unnamed protein product [Penicillium olsonii]|uniref:DNA polymerase delta subunit 4 n=1 Tax=Penicillium olsonii TaxID=99116 RepID=A0A9W4HT71_PENOL|nr:unnamed protein product [Penicillium olsonii]CAG8148155.1 unnamed protein product [Penicillium olsonii]